MGKKIEHIDQTVDKKLFSPFGGRIALSANERIAEFLDFAIQAKFAYVNKLHIDFSIHSTFSFNNIFEFDSRVD